MAEGSEVSAPQVPPTTEMISGSRTRVYIGGLGASVTEEDLKKTFSSLGDVGAVDMVRTKGRSFAYINFLPSSDKSLMKLFSTYNGCSWKGGKLRLEKAKEHYLDRMRREWAEDAELAISKENNDTDAHKAAVSLAKPKKDLNSDKMQIRIFFPKLKKMKSLPVSGTGKHKYSFQRVEVASRPIHVCGCCEAYSVPSQLVKASHNCNPSLQDGGMHEEEIDMMQSVMIKLFERENGSTAIGISSHRSPERESDLPVQDGKVDADADDADTEADADAEADAEADAAEDDDEDLIINVVGGYKKISLLDSWTQETALTNELTGSSKISGLEDVHAKNLNATHKEKFPASKEKRKAAPTIQNTELVSPLKRTKLQAESNQSEARINSSINKREPTSMRDNMSSASLQKSSWKNLVGDVDNSTFSLSILRPNNLSNDKEPIEPVERLSGKTETESADSVEEADRLPVKDGPSEKIAPSGKPSIGSSWLQKSPWTQLVGNGNCCFSLSQILPKQDSQRPTGHTTKRTYSTKFDAMKQKKSNVGGGTDKVPESQNEGEGPVTVQKSSAIYHDKRELEKQAEIHNTADVQDVTGDEGPSTTALPERRSAEPTQACSVVEADGEICPFMRTAASIKAWKQAKAALTKNKNK